MKVIERSVATIADNQNSQPNVHNLPLGLFTGKVSYEQAEAIRQMIAGEIDEVDVN